MAQGRVIAQGQEKAIPGNAPAVVEKCRGQGDHRRHPGALAGCQVQGQVGTDAQAAHHHLAVVGLQAGEFPFHLGVPGFPGMGGVGHAAAAAFPHRVAGKFGNAHVVAGLLEDFAQGRHFGGVAVQAMDE